MYALVRLSFLSSRQDWAVHYWLKKGADRSKLLLGLATYGRTFTLADSSKHGLGDAATAAGHPGKYTDTAGFLTYYEVTTRAAWLIPR